MLIVIYHYALNKVSSDILLAQRANYTNICNCSQFTQKGKLVLNYSPLCRSKSSVHLRNKLLWIEI